MLSIFRRLVVVTLAAIVFIGTASPALAHSRESSEVDSSCVDGKPSAGIDVTLKDKEWLNDYFTAGETYYVINNGLTLSAFRCFLGRKQASESPLFLPTSNRVSSSAREISPAAEQWRSLVEANFPDGWAEWGMRIMQCESGGNPTAKNQNSTAAGLFQFLKKTWNRVAGTLGFPDYDSGAVYNPVMNIEAAAWLLEDSGTGQWACKASK